jgi:hypothetical protein
MKHRSLFVTRFHAVKRVEMQLLSRSFPRFQMLLLVTLTGGFGLLASFGMLHLGVDMMAVRYPLALAIAYLFFLLLIWLWLRTSIQDYLDVPDVSDFALGRGASAGPGNFTSGGGGDAAGGGASGAFDASTADLASVSDASTGTVGDVVGTVGDADELAIPLVVIALVIGLAVASLYVVYIAPTLFAEVLVDGALSYGLFRHLGTEDRPRWLTSAMRRTVAPFAATAVFLAVAGVAMTLYAPDAKSVGQVIEHATARKAGR